MARVQQAAIDHAKAQVKAQEEAGGAAIGGMSMLALPDQTHYIVSGEGRLGDDRWLVLDRRSGEN